MAKLTDAQARGVCAGVLQPDPSIPAVTQQELADHFGGSAGATLGLVVAIRAAPNSFAPARMPHPGRSLMQGFGAGAAPRRTP